MSVTITITGLDQAQRKFGIDLKPAIQTATRAIGGEVRSKIAVEPGPVSHPIRWASQKQKRRYFAMRREAGLPPEYTRNSDPMSQRLQPSWTISGTPTGAVVGTRATYAGWVQAADRQQPFHADTGWVTDREAVDAVVRSGVIVNIVRDAIIGALKR